MGVGGKQHVGKILMKAIGSHRRLGRRSRSREGAEDDAMVVRRIELEKAVEELLEVVFGVDVLLQDHLEHGVPEIEVGVVGVFLDGDALAADSPEALHRPEALDFGIGVGGGKRAKVPRKEAQAEVPREDPQPEVPREEPQLEVPAEAEEIPIGELGSILIELQVVGDGSQLPFEWRIRVDPLITVGDNIEHTIDDVTFIQGLDGIAVDSIQQQGMDDFTWDSSEKKKNVKPC
nr:hypothetical protein DM860_010446 [Ipomoea batatas]